MGTAVKRLGLLWSSVFIPALIGWGALIQLTAHGRTWFAHGFRWSAHLLVLPLALSPLTDQWTDWLAHSGARAVAGFLLLLALWVLMVALPLTLLLAWATWLGRHLGGAPDTGYASADPYATIPSAATVHPASRLLYLVTVPVALLAHALRWLLRTVLRYVVGATVVFVVMAGVRIVYKIIRLNDGVYRYGPWLKSMLDFYLGPYRLLGFHLLFGGRWQHAFAQSASYDYAFALDPRRYQEMIDHPSSYPGIMPLLLWDAVMFGLMCAVIYLVLRLILRLLDHH